jgi:lipopolysaccharide export system protein LptA
LFAADSAHALDTDRDRPLSIKATSVEANEKTGVAVYRGNVAIRQGSLQINADRVEIRTSAKRTQRVTATGKPARLRLQPTPEEKEVVAFAERVVYDLDKHVIDLEGNVHIQQGGDEFRAPRAHYVLDENHLTADADDDARVSAILQPRPRAERTTP